MTPERLEEIKDDEDLEGSGRHMHNKQLPSGRYRNVFNILRWGFATLDSRLELLCCIIYF
jgi:hypothetical protein